MSADELKAKGNAFIASKQFDEAMYVFPFQFSAIELH
jgi:hypothetical protein